MIKYKQLEKQSLRARHLVRYLRNSSTRMTGNESHTTATHSAAERGVTEKMRAAGGT